MATLGNRFNSVMLVLVFLSLLAVLGMLARDARGGPLDPSAAPASTDGVKLPGTPISSVPYVISSPGRYYLTRDLTYAGTGNAIAIAGFVDYVTLDLNGFTLGGMDTGTGIKALGPSAPAQFPLIVMNGYVRDFEFGVDLVLSAHARLEDIHAFSNTSFGIRTGNHSVMEGCTSANNAGAGVALAGTMATMRGCMIVDNGAEGVVTVGLNVIEDSEILRNNVGVHLLGGYNVVRDNIVFLDALASFAGGSDFNKIRDNVYCAYGASGTNEFVGNSSHCP